MRRSNPKQQPVAGPNFNLTMKKTYTILMKKIEAHGPFTDEQEALVQTHWPQLLAIHDNVRTHTTSLQVCETWRKHFEDKGFPKFNRNHDELSDRMEWLEVRFDMLCRYESLTVAVDTNDYYIRLILQVKEEMKQAQQQGERKAQQQPASYMLDCLLGEHESIYYRHCEERFAVCMVVLQASALMRDIEAVKALYMQAHETAHIDRCAELLNKVQAIYKTAASRYEAYKQHAFSNLVTC